MKTYEQVPLLAEVIATVVCEREYTAQEYSERNRDPQSIAKVEALRQAMTREQIVTFARWADKRCRQAFEAKADWYMKCLGTKGTRGRDQLYVWITHWMVAFLTNPNIVNQD